MQQLELALPRPVQPDEVELDVATLVSAGIIRATRRTRNGRVTEYELTHLGRLLLERTG